jgi:hypothetical protein
MKKLILPVVMLLVGAGSGIAAGLLSKSAPEDMANLAEHPCGDPSVATAENHSQEEGQETDPDLVPEYAKLNNQFIIPVLTDDRVTALMAMSISVEVPAGGKERVFETEPKLRDSFLQVLFNHANIGGFSGNYTTTSNMRVLRQDLLRAAKSVLGDGARDILILDIVRQES